MKTGVQRDFNLLILLDTGFRRYDGKVDFPTFCEFINIGEQQKSHSACKATARLKFKQQEKESRRSRQNPVNPVDPV